MGLSAEAKQYYEKRFGQESFGLAESDPEFSVLFSNFAFDEVLRESRLDDKTRYLAVLAALLCCQGLDTFRPMVPGALKSGVTPVELKELVYQGTAYLGLGRALPFLLAANALLAEDGTALPLPSRGTVTGETRIEAGNQAQVDIFGEQMRGFQNSGPEETRQINRWLAGNCFGDYSPAAGWIAVSVR